MLDLDQEREFYPEDILSVAYYPESNDLVINVKDEEEETGVMDYHLPLYDPDSTMDAIESILDNESMKYGYHNDIILEDGDPEVIGSMDVEFTSRSLTSECESTVMVGATRLIFNITPDQLDVIHDAIYTESECDM